MITHEQLKQLIHYDPATGSFTRLVDQRHGRNKAFLAVKAGDVAGFHGSYGYLYFVVDKTRMSSHRWAWFYMTGERLLRHMDIDHINGVRDDNRWANLRLASRSENMQNMKAAHSDSQTGFLGVERKREKFSARICLNGKRYSIGSFDTAELAHSAYLQAKRKLHPRSEL